MRPGSVNRSRENMMYYTCSPRDCQANRRFRPILFFPIIICLILHFVRQSSISLYLAAIVRIYPIVAPSGRALFAAFNPPFRVNPHISLNVSRGIAHFPEHSKKC